MLYRERFEVPLYLLDRKNYAEGTPWRPTWEFERILSAKRISWCMADSIAGSHVNPHGITDEQLHSYTKPAIFIYGKSWDEIDRIRMILKLSI